MKLTNKRKNVKRPFIIYELMPLMIVLIILLFLYRGVERLLASGLVEKMVLAGRMRIYCTFGGKYLWTGLEKNCGSQ